MAQYGLTLVTAPALEPITTAEARLQCGVADESAAYFDSKLLPFVQAARKKFESDTGRAVMTQTWDYTFDLWPYGLEAIYIPKAPVSAITSVKYYDTNNAQQTLATSVYKTFLDREPAEIRLKNGQQWPSLYGEQGVITVRFVAGYGDATNEVPEDAKSAIKLKLTDLFENRDEESKAYRSFVEGFIFGDEFHTYSRSLCV